MKRCITQIPLVASGEDLEEHKATKTRIKIGISLSQDEMISGFFFFENVRDNDDEFDTLAG